jgi:hypothetical protein
MVKATLRTNPTAKPSPVIDVKAEVVNEKIESTLGVGVGQASQDLTSLLPSQEPTAADVAAATGEPAPAAATAPATTSHNRSVQKYQPAPVEGFDGDWGADDVKFPQLKLVQGSGPLSQTFDAGSIIYGEELLFGPASVREGAPKQLIKFAPISITKQWREKLSQEQVGEGLMPRIVGTIAEVEELGGTTRWVGNQMPENLWEPSARCILLIEQPTGCEHAGFNMELDGKMFSVAVYYAAGGAFRASAKVIFNTAMTQLLVPVLNDANEPLIVNGRAQKRPLLYKNFWHLSFAKVQAGNFTPWRPVVKLLSKEETGPDVRAYCEGLTKSAEQVEAAAAAE